MKKTNIILLFLMALAWTSCHKDKEMDVKEAVVSNLEATVSRTRARFLWQVDFVGQFQTGMEVSPNENMAEPRRVEAWKLDDHFVTVVDSLTEGTKYYYRVVVWNKLSSWKQQVNYFTTTDETYYTIAFSCLPENGGSVSGGGTFAEGDTCTLVAAANEGYTFANWTENGDVVSEDANYTFTVTDDRSLVANFTTFSLTTNEVTNITQTTATGGGNMSFGEDTMVTELGICWSTIQHPTNLQDSHASIEPENGTFSVNMTGLLPETTYYVRAYAIIDRNINIYFGNEVSFTTLHQSGYTISISADPSNGGAVSGGGTYQMGQSCTVRAVPYNGFSFSKWTEYGMNVSTNANYTFTVNENRVLVANFVYNGGGGGTHDYVDLGLPSGTLWATCNVGADSPEDYGDYFAWGEIQPKDIYYWNTYLYCMGSNNTLTKYCSNASYGYNGFSDNLIVLEASDDVATTQWGSGWRMPTQAEWQELYQNTTKTWTTQNGVNGRLFTASNGNSLFLPAAGYCLGSNIYDAGSNGNYGSSSLYTDSPNNAWSFHFHSGNCNLGNYSRNYGRSVRAVCSSRQN